MGTSPETTSDPACQLLRHTLATLAYRGAKAFRGTPAEFARFRVGEKSRTPEQILAHIGDLLDWALSLAKGRQEWQASEPLPWEQNVGRFFSSLAALDACLASQAPLSGGSERIFQGPIADAFTHVGQISMLRRLAGFPVRGENYLRADVVAGRVGPEQTPARREFD